MGVMTNVVELVVRGSVATTGSGSKAFNNVFHYRLSSGTADVPSAVGAAFNTNVWAVIAARLSSLYTGVQIDCRMLDDAFQQYVTDGTPANGAVTGSRYPTEIAVTYLLRTATRGKSYRGSKHFGPVATSDTLNDELTATAATAWAAVTTALKAALTPGFGTWKPCVVSRTLSQLRTNPTTIVGDDITDAILNKTLGTMRRRKEKTVR